MYVHEYGLIPLNHFPSTLHKILPVAAGAKEDDPPMAATAEELVVVLKIELSATGFVAPNIPEPLAAESFAAESFAAVVVVAPVPKTEPNCKHTC